MRTRLRPQRPVLTQTGAALGVRDRLLLNVRLYRNQRLHVAPSAFASSVAPHTEALGGFEAGLGVVSLSELPGTVRMLKASSTRDALDLLKSREFRQEMPDLVPSWNR